MLDFAQFRAVVEHTPLISIDLIVYNSDGEVLLGKRNNAPAKDYYFVPGGRIYKNEKIADAFHRVCLSEIGMDIDLSEAKFFGVFEHFYSDSFVSEDVNTHYVVLAYELHLNLNLSDLPFSQHEEYIFLDVQSARHNEKVHAYTQQYFN
ncbi:GDP-mannose mannosyl hydrolase [Enterobacter sp. Cy-643]|uniref:GDP-mannose mannosyl hydrolase n=1 Tax=Enterobacter sp. Cy-643 TaxID=2608346 RepID=UPI00141D971E|nr:GDP-mannose mannosyl hydrolase [Enterobacter sp. Cy-643]NIF31125.1 GDP-mannose mannosyl hydrolase [Enterobacter sp. Cy-643]